MSTHVPAASRPAPHRRLALGALLAAVAAMVVAVVGFVRFPGSVLLALVAATVTVWGVEQPDPTLRPLPPGGLAELELRIDVVGDALGDAQPPVDEPVLDRRRHRPEVQADRPVRTPRRRVTASSLMGDPLGDSGTRR